MRVSSSDHCNLSALRADLMRRARILRRLAHRLLQLAVTALSYAVVPATQ